MRYLIAILALAGVVVSALALRVHYSTETQPCSINAKWDCGIVNHSPYAEVAGIPVAAIGIAGYVLMGGLALQKRRRLALAAMVPALGYSLYLTHLEKDVLGVYCLYCVISLGILTTMTLCTVGWQFAGQFGGRAAAREESQG